MGEDAGSGGGDAPRGSQGGEERRVGGLVLGEERLAIVLPQWEAMHRSIRLMDSLELGETEPATVYAWEEQP